MRADPTHSQGAPSTPAHRVNCLGLRIPALPQYGLPSPAWTSLLQNEDADLVPTAAIYCADEMGWFM